MARVTRYLFSVSIAAAVGAISANADPTIERCDARNGMTFVDWSEWTQITPHPVLSEGHSNNWVGIFVDELAKAAYLSGSAPFPECAKIVKTVYSDGEGTSVRKLTVMVKMPAGYDPENGDWWYASYDATGAYVRAQGRLHECISCHKQAAETDYLFSTRIMSQIQE